MTKKQFIEAWNKGGEARREAIGWMAYEHTSQYKQNELVDDIVEHHTGGSQIVPLHTYTLEELLAEGENTFSIPDCPRCDGDREMSDTPDKFNCFHCGLLDQE